MQPIPFINNSYQFQNKYFLNKEIIDEIDPFLTETELKKLPMACQGQSCDRIRILESKKVLIRIAHDDNQLKNLFIRLVNMSSARNIIIANNLKQIKIPKANLTKNYLVEKLLPCIKGGFFSTLNYYIQHHSFFDNAVSEFTLFLMKTNMVDIVACGKWMKSNWPCGVPRYDNILVYGYEKNKETRYKIGLIDLEGFYDRPIQENHIFQVAKNAILLFPYQYDIVIETCQNEYIFNLEELKQLETFKKEAFTAINRIYTKQHDFILAQDMLPINPFLQFLDSPEQKNQMIEELAENILKRDEHYGHYFTYCVKSNDINFDKRGLSCNDPLNSVTIKLKLLGENTLNTLNFLKQRVFQASLNDICEAMKDKIYNSKSESTITNYSAMSQRSLSFKGLKCNELFKLKHQDFAKHYSFTIKQIFNRNDENITDMDSFFSDFIVKREFQTGRHLFTTINLILLLFKEKGFCAKIFFDEEITTFFF